MEKKKTKLEFLKELERVVMSEEHKGFVAKEIELLSKKSSMNKVPKHFTEDNEVIKPAVLDILQNLEEGKGIRITEMINQDDRLKPFSCQRVSGVCKILVDTRVIKRDKKSNYSI